MNTLEENAWVLTREFEWLNVILLTRIALYFGHDTPYKSVEDVPVPDLNLVDGPYAEFVREHGLNRAERLALILSLVPHLKPELLDILCTKNKEYDRRFSEFGGLFLDGHSGMIPTAETVMFVLAGDDLSQRLHFHYLLHEEHRFFKAGWIANEYPQKYTPWLSGSWILSHEYVGQLVNGEPYQIRYGESFPASLITTGMEWEDMILASTTQESLQEIRDWIKHGDRILKEFGLGKRIKPGYKSLFYGPPGTGKTMTAALLGKSTGRKVYKIDLSLVVSKYIGETEKNLSKVFDQAESQNWILFFDEADALFGKRTQVQSSNDRYGNQEIGYLLQRTEDFPGVVLLASNLKENIDEAFTRRFQSMIGFRMPGVAERFKLWNQSFSDHVPLDSAIDRWALAEKYELSGGVMMNVVRKATLKTVAMGKKTISKKELEQAIRQEQHKEGILLS